MHEYRRLRDWPAQPILIITLSPRARMCPAISSPHCSDTAPTTQSKAPGGLQPHGINMHTTETRSRCSPVVGAAVDVMHLLTS